MAVLWVICALLAVVLFLVARRLYQARARVERLESRLASVLVRGETGLSVWSSEGRLVACNARFREFYPDVPIKHGLELEDLVRFTVTRGLVQVPEDEIESWVNERLAGMYQPRHDVARTADGRWLAFDIGPTNHGEILMLYTDVTDTHDAGTRRDELVAQVGARSAELDLLLRVVEISGHAGTFASAAQPIIGVVCEWTGWPEGHAYRVDLDTDQVEPIRDTLQAGNDAFASLRTALADERPHAARDLVGRVLRSGRVVWVAHVDSDPTFSGERREIMKGVRGACGVPVTSGDRVVAVLEFLSREPLVPVPSQAALLEAIGTILGWVSDRRAAS